jgi:hypothetical protein
VLLADDHVRWSLFAVAGAGIAATAIDPEGDPEEYSSTTTRIGLELGCRLGFGRWELGLGAVGRWQDMDESDPEDGDTVPGYAAVFRGVMLSVGARF